MRGIAEWFRARSPEASRTANAPREPATTGSAELDGFLDRFDEGVQAIARRCLEWVRARVPGATELVYDAYNALSVPFAKGDRLGDAFVSVVIYPRYVNVAFFRGAELEDPARLLRGTGGKMRHVRIDDAAKLDAKLAALVRQAAERAGFRRAKSPGPILVKAIYPRQRSRRPRGPTAVSGSRSRR
jgi:hypothetical protein